MELRGDARLEFQREFRPDPFPDDRTLGELWLRAWGMPPAGPFNRILKHGLGHIGAYNGERLIGFVNIAWDGGVHAFILGTCTDPDFRRRGIGLGLVQQATALARSRGAEWLHVDFEPHLTDFYRACGFQDSAAGIMKLLESKNTPT